MIGKIIVNEQGKKFEIIEHYRNADEMVAESKNGGRINVTSMEIAEGKYEVK